MEQLKDERFVHLQALVDMDGQLEAMDQDLEVANELIQVLQQPVPPPAPRAMKVKDRNGELERGGVNGSR
jgi:hypothetical protein